MVNSINMHQPKPAESLWASASRPRLPVHETAFCPGHELMPGVDLPCGNFKLVRTVRALGVHGSLLLQAYGTT